MKVAIGITTFRRPHGLARLLDSLAQLTFRDDRPDLYVVVVDNDAGASARDVCRASGSGLDLRYVVEPRQGTSFGRNRAIAAAGDAYDFLAMIDDDEAAQADWLERLLAAQRAFAADVVAGPVDPVFPAGTPGWIVRGGFFRRRRHCTGQLLDVAYAGNVLIRANVLRRREKHFDERFALTGGEDSHFFRRLAKEGCRLVWADDARVREWIPVSRATASWLIRRAFRSANTMALIDVDLSARSGVRLVVAAKGLVWLAAGLVGLPAGLVLGRATLVKAARHIAYGAGLLLGLCGVRYREYRQTHGS